MIMSLQRLPPFSQAGVVGAGLMGVGIGAVLAAAGIHTMLSDVDAGRLAAATRELQRLADELVDATLLPEAERTALPARVQYGPTASLAGLPLVFEAVPENLALKREVYAQLETVLAPEAIICSNTSSLMPAALAADLRHPERLLVTHFFNPPHAVPLVEVVPSPATDPAVVTQTLAFLHALGQVPVLVRKEVPGFIGNRLQYALLREAMALVQAGVATPEEVDTVITTSIGRRYSTIGPFETVDLNGVDLFLTIGEDLLPRLANDERSLDLLRERVAAGKLGLRSGEGFYSWSPERIASVRGRRDRDLLRRRLDDRQNP
jgi:3-hydroxybutyryl-CoA dehydrogenase